MDSEIFEKLSPTKIFFRCAIPTMITSVFGALYSMADGFFVGRFVGEEALAAVNIVMPIIMIAFALSDMIAAGSSAHISVLLGQHEREKASLVFSFSLKMIFFFSCVIGVIGYFGADSLIALLAKGATEQTVDYCVTYLKVYILFAPLLPVYFATDNYLRVCGKEKLSMWIAILTQLLNVVLDVILIAVFGMGVWAAAFTSCVSMALGSVITVLLFVGKRQDLYFVRGKLSPAEIFRIAANGFSEFFENIAMSVMSLVLNFYLLFYGGTTAVAAMSVVMYVDSVVGMLGFGMCSSLQPAISYCYGTGNLRKVRQIFLRGVTAKVVISAVSLVTLFFFGSALTPIFVREESTELIGMSVSAMQWFAFSYLFGWIDSSVSSLFTALEKAGRSLVISVFGSLFFPIGFLAVFAAVWGLDGIWAMPVASAFAGAIVAILLVRPLWKELRS